MKKLLIAILAASGAAVVYAQAETPNREGRDGGFRAEMRALITGDGMTVEDLTGLLQERSQAQFQALDADDDGIVSRADFLAAAVDRAETRFERLGPDEDGIVKRSGREGWGRHHRGDGARADGRAGKGDKGSAERIERQFSRLDTDGDGVISRDEYAAGIETRGERFAERREQREQRRERWAGHRAEMPEEMREMHRQLRALMRDGMNLESFSGLMQEQAGARFDALDANGDGELTAGEFTAGVSERAERLFARMDRNEDGVVTRDDRPRGGGNHRHGPRG